MGLFLDKACACFLAQTEGCHLGLKTLVKTFSVSKSNSLAYLK